MLKNKNTLITGLITGVSKMSLTASIFVAVMSVLALVIIAGCGGSKNNNTTGPSPTPLTGYFVSPSGDDSNPGSQDSPLRTIQTAINYAAQEGNRVAVHVAEGNYALTMPLILKDRISLMGGYSSTNWDHDPAAYKTFLRGAADSLVIRGAMADSLQVDGFVMICADASDVGANARGHNAIAVALDSCLAVTFSNDSLVVGDASAGGNGSNGSSGNTGGDGYSGENGGICPNAGGYGSGYYSYGGDGGSGGDVGGFAGDTGDGPAGGSGGSGGSLASDGHGGSNGGPGAAGANGSGGTSFGVLHGLNYTPASGGSGTAGSIGSGGGGGGGGGGSIIGLCGAGGGGGGGGGYPGNGGIGGGGGGASIGFIIANYTDVGISSTSIVTGNGGNGGNGGNRGIGLAGGNGASGGNSGVGTGAGGHGGNGGRGGDGGYGAGGGGGPVIGILEDATSHTNRADNTVMLGDPGTGGTSIADSGADGVQEDYMKMPE